MFDLLEKSVKLNLTGLNSCLKRTYEEIWVNLKNKPIVFLTYRQVPLLYATEVMNGIGEYLKDHFEAVISDIIDSPPSPRTLFLVYANKLPQPDLLWSYIAKHLIESKGLSKFIVLVSQDDIRKFDKTGSYLLLKPYYHVFTEIAEDPAKLLEWLTDIKKSPPTYKERRLPELIFMAVVSKMEDEWLDEGELSDLMSSFSPMEFNGQQKCYFFRDRLTRLSGIMDIYFESIGLKQEHRAIAREDRNFYTAACLARFFQLGLERRIGDLVVRESANEATVILKIIKLRDSQQSHPQLRKVLSFLHRLSLVYTIAEETEPFVFMGITGQELAEDRQFRTDLLWVAKNVFDFEDALLKEDWKQIGNVMQLYIIVLATSRLLDFTATTKHIETLIKEFLRRINNYSENECKNLLLKTLKTAYLLECSAGVAEFVLDSTLAENFLKIWAACLEQRPLYSILSETERGELSAKIEHLSKLNSKYGAVKGPMQTTRVRAWINDEFEKNKQASDRIDHFFNSFASLLNENDFFVDTHKLNELGTDLANFYLELDTKLQKRLPPFSNELLETKDITSLVASLPIFKFDRIYLLIIDALSYLDWKLTKREYEGLQCSIKEDYRISTVPTYTPCALTALITGYHPSITGVCDWKLRTSTGEIIDLVNSLPSTISKKSSFSLPKKNTLTLMHSMIDTPLTVLHNQIADITGINIPSSEHESAIAQVAECIYKQNFQTKVVAIYIPDFDHFGHYYLKQNSYREYYSAQASRIKNGLLIPIMKRAQKNSERTLAILTADHGKLTRYESRILGKILPESKNFDSCTSLLKTYDHEWHPRYIVAWVPKNEIKSLEDKLKSNLGSDTDVFILTGDDLTRFFPHESRTSFLNPNLLILSRFRTGGQPAVHGGASMSEVVIPAVNFVFERG